MSKEEFIEKIKEIKISVPDEDFFLYYNNEIYKILDENEKIRKGIMDLVDIRNYLVDFRDDLQQRIDKAIEYIEENKLNGNKISEMLCGSEIVKLLEILKGEK